MDNPKSLLDFMRKADGKITFGAIKTATAQIILPRAENRIAFTIFPHPTQTFYYSNSPDVDALNGVIVLATTVPQYFDIWRHGKFVQGPIWGKANTADGFIFFLEVFGPP